VRDGESIDGDVVKRESVHNIHVFKYMKAFVLIVMMRSVGQKLWDEQKVACGAGAGENSCV